MSVLSRLRRPARVVVAGNVGLDMIFEVDRLPQAGETLLAEACRTDLGGKGANQAIAVARTGREVAFLTSWGDDAEGGLALDALSAEGIVTIRAGRHRFATDRSMILVEPSGDNVIVSTHSAADAFEVVPDEALAGGRAGELMLLQGNLAPKATRALLEWARQSEMLTVLNPSPLRAGIAELWPLADCLVANRGEAFDLSGIAEAERAAAWFHEAGVGIVVITLGPDGALVVTADGMDKVEGIQVAAVDAVGAGDVFCGIFVGGLARGLDPVAAARWANSGAAVSVTRRGTQSAFPSRAELATLLAGLQAMD
jgi:ribokinase